jgi:prophage regulatory protein
MSTEPRTFLRLKDVIRRTTYSRTRIYELINLRQFPGPIHLGARAVAWLESDVNDWMEARINASRKAKA